MDQLPWDGWGSPELTLEATSVCRSLPSVREKGEEVRGILIMVSVGGETARLDGDDRWQ
jgi:hypothetical protein